MTLRYAARFGSKLEEDSYKGETMKKPLFKNLKEIKEFITWCKYQNVESFRLEDIYVNFKESFEQPKVELELNKEEEFEKAKQVLAERARIQAELEKTENEELLFWSSKPR